MMGGPSERSEKLFYVGLSLEDRVPRDHRLRAIDAAIDFGFVRAEVAHLYGDNGHVSLDPAMTLRMMLLVYLEGVRSEREFMRQLPMRLDWLWFCRLDLDSVIPDHSVLSKARRRWGEELFGKVFARVLEACDRAGLVGGKTVHADSTLLKASADREGRISRKLWEQMENGLQPDEPLESSDDDDPRGPALADRAASPERSERAKLNSMLVSPVDPDAATHTRRGVGTILGYRDHRLTDDQHGIILATHVTPADGDDGAQLPVLLERMEDGLGRRPEEATGDSQYGTRSNYEYCERRAIKPYLKKRRGKGTPRVSWVRLLRPGCTPGRALRLMSRRRCVAEGSFAEAHTRMDHRRCRWRGRWRVQIQAHLVAMVQNIKKLAGSRPRAAGGAAAAPLSSNQPRMLLAIRSRRATAFSV